MHSILKKMKKEIATFHKDYFMVFLDIDGVLNNQDFYRQYSITEFHQIKKTWSDKYHTPCLNPNAITELVNFVNYFMEKDIKVIGILSSSWRSNQQILDKLNSIFRDFGCITDEFLVSWTGWLDGFRGAEVQKFIDDNKNCINLFKSFNYLIIDDDGDFFDYQKDKHFYQTNRDTGFLYDEAVKICKINNICL